MSLFCYMFCMNLWQFLFLLFITHRSLTLIYVCRKMIQEQCKLVLEENELLMEQLDVQEQKHKEQHKIHVHEGLKFETVFATELYFVFCHLPALSLPKHDIR